MIKFLYKYKGSDDYWEKEVDQEQYDSLLYYDLERDFYGMYDCINKAHIENTTPLNIQPLTIFKDDIREKVVFELITFYTDCIKFVDLLNEFTIHFKLSILQTDMLSKLTDLYFFKLEKELEADKIILYL